MYFLQRQEILSKRCFRPKENFGQQHKMASKKCVGATTRTGREIQCLLYVGFILPKTGDLKNIPFPIFKKGHFRLNLHKKILVLRQNILSKGITLGICPTNSQFTANCWQLLIVSRQDKYQAICNIKPNSQQS